MSHRLVVMGVRAEAMGACGSASRCCCGRDRRGTLCTKLATACIHKKKVEVSPSNAPDKRCADTYAGKTQTKNASKGARLTQIGHPGGTPRHMPHYIGKTLACIGIGQL
jgi:hypothetical protein